MIMAREDGGQQRRRPAANHPWNHPQRRLQATDNPRQARTCKVTMCVTKAEFLILRSKALGISMSDYLRANFPESLFEPPRQDAR